MQPEGKHHNRGLQKGKQAIADESGMMQDLLLSKESETKSKVCGYLSPTKRVFSITKE